MNYSDAIQFLYDLRWFGAKLGLTNTMKLAALSGNPQSKLRFIHVAGTNGKGSTCAMLEGIYRAAGLRTGLFTSPHLVAFGERIQVNRQLISEAEVVRLVGEMRELIEGGWGIPANAALPPSASAEHPTFFEVVTVMALRHFAAQSCDLVIWETGLGGRLDATNIVTPLASVITNIQYDHQEWLGETLSSIAAEKAGIIKPGVPVITAADAPEALEVIQETARRQTSPLEVVTPADASLPPLDTIELPLLGKHQRLNAAVAIATVRALAAQIPVNDDALRAGLSGLHWPGRLQLSKRSSGQRILLDGAHNVGGAQMLAAALQEYFLSAPATPLPSRSSRQPAVASAKGGHEEALTSFGPGALKRPPVHDCSLPMRRKAGDRHPESLTLILGILRDKDWAGMCQILAPLANRILLVPVPSERSARLQDLALACRRANPQAEVSEHSALRAALSVAGADEFVAIAGSLYLVGEAMELLQISPIKGQGERGLNEWGGMVARDPPPSDFGATGA